MIPRRAIALSVAGWAAFVSMVGYWHVRYILNLNTPGPVEVELHDPIFQVIAFLIQYGGRLILLLAAALTTEMIVFWRRDALSMPKRIALGSAFVAIVAIGTYAAAAVPKAHLAFGACRTLDTIECEDIAVDSAAAVVLAALAAAGFLWAIIMGARSLRKGAVLHDDHAE